MKYIAIVLVFMTSVCSGQVFDRDGQHEQLSAELQRINDHIGGGCPSKVTVWYSNQYTSQFHPSDAAITIGDRFMSRINSVGAHEMLHLCLSRISGGTSNTEGFRFFDEGYANYWSNQMEKGDEFTRNRSYQMGKRYFDSLNFRTVRSWSTFFGQQGKGTAGWNAYWVGTSFIYYESDTYGEAKVHEMFRNFGSHWTFGGAMETTFHGKDLKTIEKEWQEYVASK